MAKGKSIGNATWPERKAIIARNHWLKLVKAKINKLKTEGRTQAEIAKICGLTPSTIGRYLENERGESITLVAAFQLYYGLGFDPGEMLIGINPGRFKGLRLLQRLNISLDDIKDLSDEQVDLLREIFFSTIKMVESKNIKPSRKPLKILS